MGFRNWITQHASKTAEVVVEQTKESLQKNMQTKVVKKGEVWFTVGKIGFMALILLLTGKEASRISDKRGDAFQQPQLPTTITINNYIRDDREEKNNG